MPGFVDIMGIAGNRIDLASGFLELWIILCQIFQLRRANEGKVRRLEEEHAPLSQHILFRNRLKTAVAISLHGKIADFFLNERYKNPPFHFS